MKPQDLTPPNWSGLRAHLVGDAYRYDGWSFTQQFGDFEKTLFVDALYRAAKKDNAAWIETLVLEYYSGEIAQAHALVFQALGPNSNLNVACMAMLTRFLAWRAKADYNL